MEERLKLQQSLIKEKESEVIEVSKKVKELMKQNQELVRQHSDKDLELMNERKKSLSLQQKLSMLQRLNLIQKELLEYGFRCSWVLVSWLLLIILGMLIIFVGIYKYRDTSSSCSRESDL